MTVAATWIVASLPLVPVLWKYQAVLGALGLSRTPADMLQFSATPSSLLRASPLLAFWPPLPGRTEEDYLFPGLTVVALITAGLIVGALRVPLRQALARRSPLLFYAGAATLMYALSFGPAPPDGGIAGLLHPYTVLTFLPGYDGLRTPARFAMFGTLCLSIAAGLALCVLMRRAGRARTAIASIALVGLCVDGWMRPMPMAGPPGRLVLPEVSSAAVLELPADDAAVNVAAMYRAIFHRRPVINGYTGYTPPHYAILTRGLRRGDPSIPIELARGRPLVIVVSDRSDPGQEWRRYVEGLPGVEARGAGSGGLLYVLRAQPAARTPPSGATLPATVTEVAPQRIVIDLGGERIVRTLEFNVRWHYQELGKRIAIEASPDRSTWSTVWEDWTGGPALEAALDEPLTVPLRIALPDVRTRYLRVHPAPGWLARELKVLGPS